MSEGKVTTERRGHVLLIGLDRAAKRNAFDVAMYGALARAYAELDRDDELRAGVLFAHGEHFTAGLDLAQFTPVFAAREWPVPEGAIDPLGIRGRVLRKPIVCAIRGICLTIGIELALATDIRVAARTRARTSRKGSPPSWSGARRGSRAVDPPSPGRGLIPGRAGER